MCIFMWLLCDEIVCMCANAALFQVKCLLCSTPQKGSVEFNLLMPRDMEVYGAQVPLALKKSVLDQSIDRTNRKIKAMRVPGMAHAVVALS
jgi:hypothetical protein